jgi:DNA-directed RNA polymerase subunit beta
VARLRVRPQGHPLRPHRPPPQAARDGAAARARYSTEELLNYFYDTETIHFEPGKKYSRQVNYELLVGQRATRDIRNPKTRTVLVKKNRKFTKGAIRKLQESGVDVLPIDLDELVGKVSAKDVIDDSTGEVLLSATRS